MKSRKSLVRPRAAAYKSQSGLCYYCGQPMWQETPEQFASRYRIGVRLAKRFQCTGEHLIAHKDGGTASQSNIVAACRFCNQTRHKKKSVPTPERYQQQVQHRISKGKWHPVLLA